MRVLELSVLSPLPKNDAAALPLSSTQRCPQAFGGSSYRRPFTEDHHTRSRCIHLRGLKTCSPLGVKKEPMPTMHALRGTTHHNLQQAVGPCWSRPQQGSMARLGLR